MKRLPKLLLVSWLCLRCAGPVLGSDAEDPAQIFAKLKEYAQGMGFLSLYYDMHGNPAPGLRTLAIGRYKYTSAICAEIDATDPKKYPAYIYALHGVLAKVADPASIPWLEAKLKGPRGKELAEDFVRRFQTPSNYIASPEKWASFFEAWLSWETNPETRKDITWAMWRLDTPRAAEYLRRIVANKKTVGVELVIALYAVVFQDGAVPANRVTDAINSLRRSKESWSLSMYLGDLRNEAAVPYLLSIVKNPDDQGETEDIRASLAAITFQPELKTRGEWQKWGREHLKDGRVGWMRQSSDEILGLAKKDLPAAKKKLQRLLWSSWNDPVMLPIVELLVEYRDLRRDLLAWADKTGDQYRYVPGFAAKVAALKERINTAGLDPLPPSSSPYQVEDMSNMSWEMYNSFSFM